MHKEKNRSDFVHTFTSKDKELAYW